MGEQELYSFSIEYVHEVIADKCWTYLKRLQHCVRIESKSFPVVPLFVGIVRWPCDGDEMKLLVCDSWKTEGEVGARTVIEVDIRGAFYASNCSV